MVWTRILLLFGCFGSGPPKAWDASFWYLTFHSRPPKVLEAHSAPNAFRRQHFGIVRGRCFAWFGHESCCCSAVSEAVCQRLWTLAFDVWHFIAARQRFWKLIQHFWHESCCCSAVSQAVRQRLGTLVFDAFRTERFGIVRGRCFAWFRHESCCSSAVSEAVGQTLWTLVFHVWRFIAAAEGFESWSFTP